MTPDASLPRRPGRASQTEQEPPLEQEEPQPPPPSSKEDSTANPMGPMSTVNGDALAYRSLSIKIV